jgi:hypothetical protein
VKISQIETISRKDIEIDLAWLAGVVDGEGNINVGFFSNQVKGSGKDWKVLRIDCIINNTHAIMIEKATRILSELGIFFKVSLRRRDLRWRPCFVINVTGQKNTVKLLKLLLPYLTCKQEVAKQAIWVYEYRDGLSRAGNNQYTRKEKRLQDDPVLLKMVERAKELVRFRPDPLKYSRAASKPIKISKSSESIRLTALNRYEAHSQIQQ